MIFKKRTRSTYLIMLCWFVYTCSYIGKLSYNANINPIGRAFELPNAELGLVSTCFFFAYGIGQVINGIYCRRYNIKLTIFFCLLASSAVNLSLPFINNFSVVKFLWLINGAALSCLWPLLIRLLSEQLSDGETPRAVMAMGTTVATGTFIIYGISALVVAFLSYRITFIFSSAVLILAAIVWLVSFDGLTASCETEENSSAAISLPKEKSRLTGSIGIFIGVLSLFAVANNFIKDGLTTWTPNILDAIYETPSWLSILITLLLPTLAIGGAAVALWLKKRTGGFVGVCAILFTGSAVLIAAVTGLIKTPLLVLTVALFSLVSLLMSGVNNVITSMVPLHMKNRLNSGKLSGILNGFCYLGSTLSSYSLGAIADSSFGWMGVFYFLLFVCIAVIAVGAGYLIFNRKAEIK